MIQKDQLDEDINLLISHRDMLRNECELSRQLKQILKGLVNSFILRCMLISEDIGRKLNLTSVENESDLADVLSPKQRLDTSQFKVFYPSKKFRSFNSSVYCKGCKMEFKSYSNAERKAIRLEHAYYQHCIKDCRKYKQLSKFIVM